MAKKATPKDYQTYSNWQEAQNLSRHGTRDVPKKPVATSGKKTVPEVLDWGNGIPKDYLAYLNKHEMALVQAARKYKGKRSYSGIPAYPDPGDTAYKDRGQGTSSSAGLGNNVGGNYSSTDTRYGNSTGNSTVGSNTNSASDSGSIGGLGGSGGIGGLGDTRSSTDTSTTTSTTSTSADSSAMQSAAESDAVKVARESTALRADAAVGGIRSIGVGPQNTRINISNPSESAISGALSRVASQTYRDVTPTAPGGGGMGYDNARRGSATVAVGPSSGTEAFGNIAGGSQDLARLGDRVRARADQAALSRAYGASVPPAAPNAPSGAFGPRSNIPSYLRTESMPGMITTGMPSVLSGMTPPEQVQQEEEEYANGNALSRAVMNSLAEKYKTYQQGAESIPYPADPRTLVDVAEPNTTIAYKDPYRPTMAAGTYTTPYDKVGIASLSRPPGSLTSAAGTYFAPDSTPRYRSIDEAPENADEGVILDSEGNPVPQETIDEATSADEGGLPQNVPEGGIADLPSLENPEDYDGSQTTGPETVTEGEALPGVNPMQGEAVYPEKTLPQKYAEKIPYAGNALKFASWAGRKEFENLSPEERNALAAKWISENQAAMRGDVSGNRQDRVDMYEPITPTISNVATTTTTAPPTEESKRRGGPRPYKYFKWDLGMNIPSPGDADYNEYRRYLKARRVDYA